MADPFTLSFVAANCAWAMIQNRADAAAVASAKRLAEALRKQKTPANHDVLAATHTAFVCSIQLMADACQRSGGDAKDQFAARALVKVVKDRDLTTFSADPRTIPKKELDANIRAIFEGADADMGRNAAEEVIVRLEGAMGEPLTETFRTLFRDGSDKHRSWPQAFELFFAEQVKTNERVFRALAFDRLNEILASAETHADDLAALHRSVEAFERGMSARLDEMGADVKEILARLAGQEQDAPIALLRSLAEAFGEARPGTDAAALEAYLRDKIGDYHQLRTRIEAVQHEDNHDAALLADANRAIKKGDFDHVDELLCEAEELLDERIDRFLIRKSERRSLRGDAAKLKGDYEAAIAHYDAAAHMVPKRASMEGRLHAHAAARAAVEFGDRIEPNAILEGIRRWRALLKLIDRSKDPEEWAAAQNSLGIALAKLGEREDGTRHLKAAVKAFQLILESNLLGSLPINWAATQINLGSALMGIGKRTRKVAPFRASIEAYRSALEIYTREEWPEDWALTQNNLGNAFQNLGAIEQGTESLKAAVTAFNLALEVRVRADMPDQWANTQNNLGTALAVLAERGRDSACAEAAATAFRQALEVRTRETQSFQWAVTSANLGRILTFIAFQASDVEIAQEAAVILEQALEVFAHPRLAWHRRPTEDNLAFVRKLEALLLVS